MQRGKLRQARWNWTSLEATDFSGEPRPSKRGGTYPPGQSGPPSSQLWRAASSPAGDFGASWVCTSTLRSLDKRCRVKQSVGIMMKRPVQLVLRLTRHSSVMSDGIHTPHSHLSTALDCSQGPQRRPLHWATKRVTPSLLPLARPELKAPCNTSTFFPPQSSSK